MSLFAAHVVGEDTAAVLVLVTIHAEVFPVAAVGRVVVVIAVAVMNCEQVERRGIELAGALCTEPAVKLQRAGAVRVRPRRRRRPRRPHQIAGWRRRRRWAAMLAWAEAARH